MRSHKKATMWLILAAMVLAAFSAAVTTGCSTAAQTLAKTTGPPEATRLSVTQVPDGAAVSLPDEENGSLWQDGGVFSDLFDLPKARRVGDIVTIKIVESSSATNQANTLTERDSSLSARIDAFLGLEKKYLDPNNPGYNAGRNFNPFGEIKGGMTSKFDGTGTTSRSGDLTAYITARVTEVLPNGNLMIEGSREIEVNNEKQFITLAGVIRTRDVAADNIILSTYISGARITYSGVGIVDERQRPGWFANIMNKVWPF
ncbi:MAG: flagellar basal body L-ring protein FlgH [Desulfobacterales bacterium]|jgi:flagellar L-ring protein precursor FlgH